MLVVNMFNKNVKCLLNLYKLKLNKRFNHTWIQPEGYRTPIKVYNCVTRQNEPFIVKNKNFVTWYTCGPTVYDSSHIGHAACYVRLDIIQKILKTYFGLNLVTCMNITDIDDKIIQKSIETKTHYKEIAEKYEKEFWQDLKTVGISKPDIVVRVTEYIPLIIDFIKKLELDGTAYVGKDNSVYFDVSKGCKHYGKLQTITDSLPDKSNLFKRAPADFALWKIRKSETEPSYPSPWGQGRPGWHIECSSLASMIFGNNIDVHAGGIDLRFPHHENEEAQSCSFHGNNQWVNYWIHTGHLHLKDSVKMSKSLKNTISIKDALEDRTSDVFRFLCATSHYSQPIEYSDELLDTAANLLKVFKNFLNMCDEIEKGFIKVSLDNTILNDVIAHSICEIDKALCDNFNTPRVVQLLSQNVTKINTMIHVSDKSQVYLDKNFHLLLAFKNIVCSTLSLFGIDFKGDIQTANETHSTDVIELLVKFRQNIRLIGLENKNVELLKLCDSVRDNLNKQGVMVKDHGNVSSWSM